jgi:mono/diheme cytochrome c family protein
LLALILGSFTAQSKKFVGEETGKSMNSFPRSHRPTMHLEIADQQPLMPESTSSQMTLRAMQHRLDLSLKFALWIAIFSCGVTIAYGQTPSATAIPPSQGLAVTFSSQDNKSSDVTLAPSVSLYVPTEHTPTPFLSGGKFSAIWNGFLSAGLRGDYCFQAELNGTLKLEINGVLALEATGTNSASGLSKPIRLSKGTNIFKASFSSPASGDALVRLQWKPADSLLQPIPLAALTHADSPALQEGTKLRHGRELFLEHRCIKCHAGPPSQSALPELAMDAPSFESIAARRQTAWMARWIADPKALRPTARMPKVLHGEKTKDEAQAIVVFLASASTNSAARSSLFKTSPAQIKDGKQLFETLHCDACHNTPEASALDAKKISLNAVAQKFYPDSLAAFLKQPDAHFAWIRMPRFRLSEEQLNSLASYLLAGSGARAAKLPVDAALAKRGKKLVQSSGCLNCHALNLENQFSAKPLAELENVHAGCLAEKTESSKVPNFAFMADERDALQMFLASDRASLRRHVPAEFAEREIRNLNCLNCHGPVDGIPSFEILGEKLKPEWAAKFIGGGIPDKPRPWLEAQMPAFPKRAELLAQGMAMQHGFPPQTPADSAVDKEASENGHRLVSASPLGFGCVQCHAVGPTAAMQVFEAPGINLAFAGERLQPAYFKRWIRNPQSVDPQAKMPGYFDDEGRSPLTEIYGGDGEKQIQAIWHYLRLGEKMPAPKGLP